MTTTGETPLENSEVDAILALADPQRTGRITNATFLALCVRPGSNLPASRGMLLLEMWSMNVCSSHG